MVEQSTVFEKIWDWFYRWRTYKNADPGNNPRNPPTSNVEKSLTVLTDNQRKQRLDNRIAQYLKGEWAVERVGDFQAVLTFEDKVNHVVHAILSLLTAGLWVLVWLVLAFIRKPTRMTLRVNEFGHFIES